MNKALFGLVAGFVFGLGLTISQMINPEKVLGFLTLDQNWDPSLALVMLGALVVTGIGYRLVWRRKTSWLGDGFQIPTARHIDAKLVGGAVLFGLGWGLVGLCPGPAIAALSVGGLQVVWFVLAMVGGAAAYEALDRIAAHRASSGAHQLSDG